MYLLFGLCLTSPIAQGCLHPSLGMAATRPEVTWVQQDPLTSCHLPLHPHISVSSLAHRNDILNGCSKAGPFNISILSLSQSWISNASLDHPPCIFFFIPTAVDFFFNVCLFFTVLDFCCWAGFSLVVSSRSYSLVVVHELLIAVASLVEPGV